MTETFTTRVGAVLDVKFEYSSGSGKRVGSPGRRISCYRIGSGHGSIYILCLQCESKK